MNKGKYLCALKERSCFFKLKGTLKYNECIYFNKFVDTLLKDKKYNHIVIDLSEVKSIDSTNLGILAKYSRYLLKNFGKKPVLISKNKNITELLKSLSFNKVFNIVDDKSIEIEDFEMIPQSGEESKEQLGTTLLNAHKNLSEICDENKLKFFDVVTSLEKSLTKFN